MTLSGTYIKSAHLIADVSAAATAAAVVGIVRLLAPSSFLAPAALHNLPSNLAIQNSSKSSFNNFNLSEMQCNNCITGRFFVVVSHKSITFVLEVSNLESS